MSLRDKLLKKAISFLRERHSFDQFHVCWDDPSPKHAFPEPEPVGDDKVVPDLVCVHPPSQQKLILEVAATEEYMERPEVAKMWKSLHQFVEQTEEAHLFFLTYKKFGNLEGRLILRQKLREILGRSTAHIGILTYHRGKVSGDVTARFPLVEELEE